MSQKTPWNREQITGIRDGQSTVEYLSQYCDWATAQITLRWKRSVLEKTFSSIQRIYCHGGCKLRAWKLRLPILKWHLTEVSNSVAARRY